MVGGNNACHQKPLPRLFSGAAIIPHSFNTIEPKKRPLFELALGVCEVLVPCVRGQQTICSIDTLKISRLIRIYRHSASSFQHYVFENLNNSETDAFCWVVSSSKMQDQHSLPWLMRVWFVWSTVVHHRSDSTTSTHWSNKSDWTSLQPNFLR